MEDRSPEPGRHRPALQVAALIVSLALLSLALGAVAAEHARQRDSLDRALAGEADQQADRLASYFARARSLTLVTARNPAYRDFYAEPGGRREKIRRHGRALREAEQGLAYLERLFPASIEEACFIDAGGAENARAVHGRVEPRTKLSADERANPFFRPSFALGPGQVYQGRPYRSPDTGEWVISNSTPISGAAGKSPAIVHFEVSVESFRQEAARTSERFDIAIVEARSGRVIAASRHPQRSGRNVPLGRPGDARFRRLASVQGRARQDGAVDIDGRRAAARALGRRPHNENAWVVVALARTHSGWWIDDFGVLELSMAALGLLLVAFAVLSFRSSQGKLREAAMTDPLTGLANRRRLMADLGRGLRTACPERQLVLALFDLDGFKGYNDAFGHPAGDALLVRLAGRLEEAVDGLGSAYRMGGDEFCVLAPEPPGGARVLLDRAAGALTERGEGFTVGASFGSVMVPREASSPSEALRMADQRMYAHKSAGRASAGRQSTDVLMRLIAERNPELGDHLTGVTELCDRVASALSVPDEERGPLVEAASLHDIGKVAIPDQILSKPGALSDEEWAFIRQHTLIGERVLAAAPALARAAKLVRWSHERFDGSGYPDALAGEEIPLGARIIAVCDAYDAMTSSRPYRPVPMSGEGALAELRRAAGAQFDPRVVDAFCAVVGGEPQERPATPASKR